MNALVRGLKEENRQMRALTGQGEPGLFTLLGGTGKEQGSNTLTTMGGAGQVSATARIAQAYKDTRLAAVASGSSIPGGGGGTTPRPPGGGGGGGGNIPLE